MMFCLMPVISEGRISPQWAVRWYIMTGPAEYGVEIGQDSFPFSFKFSWGTGTVFGNYRNYVGLKATCSIYIPFPMTLTFVLKANNGIALYIDEVPVVYSMEELIKGRAYREETAQIFVEKGWHKLKLHYYEWEGEALVSFSFKPPPAEELFWVLADIEMRLEDLAATVQSLLEQLQKITPQ